MKHIEQIELFEGWPYAENEDENKFFSLDKLSVEETKCHLI